MEWSRVKNILIVLLVIVNLFLFLMYLNTTVEGAKDDEELVDNTVSVLSKNGITMDEDIIPRNTPILYPITAVLDNSDKVETKLMDKIPHSDLEITRIGDETPDKSEFECSFKTKLPEDKKQAAKILSRAAKGAGLEIETPQVEEKDGGYIVRAEQKLMGVPLCNAKLVLIIENDGSATLRGATIWGSVSTVQSAKPYDICGLLVGALDYLPEGEITNVRRVYHYSMSGSNGIYYLPVWQVEYDKASFFLNAMTGEIIDLTY